MGRGQMDLGYLPTALMNINFDGVLPLGFARTKQQL